MSIVGHVFNDPRNGRVTRVVAADETHGASFTLEYTQAPSRGRASAADAHVHESWNETFEVLAGNASCRIGRQEQHLAAGESVTLPKGVAHVHPWNTGSEELRVRQTSTLLHPDPAAIRDTIEAFAMLFWLTESGKVGAHGRPAPLQLALILRKLMRHGGYPAGAPPALQRPIVEVLAKLGEWRGYRDFDPRCMSARPAETERSAESDGEPAEPPAAG